MTIPESQASTTDETGADRLHGGRSGDAFVYDAFISYSRGNLDAADKIERDLEAFRLPREIRKRLGRRHLNVFRDVNDMTGNLLDSALEHHLEQSRTLVVLCSPEARRSRYVSMEINRFAQLREAEKIVPVLVAGEPNNDPGVAAADWAFPDALSDVLGADPLAADLRRAWSAKGQTGRRFAVGSACRRHCRCDDRRLDGAHCKTKPTPSAIDSRHPHGCLDGCQRPGCHRLGSAKRGA